MHDDVRPEDELDPAADTQTFQAFVDRREADERDAAATRRVGSWGTASLAAAALVAVALLVLVWISLSR